MNFREIKKIIKNNSIKIDEIEAIIAKSFNDGDITSSHRSKCNILLINREKYSKNVEIKKPINDLRTNSTNKNRKSTFKKSNKVYSSSKDNKPKCLCNTCGKSNCYNRSSYKPYCSSFSEIKPDRFKMFHQNHGQTGNGCRRPPSGYYF